MLTTKPLYRFQVQGSKGDLYEIEAGSQEVGKVWLSCTCQAGVTGMYCKHRFALLNGDVSALVSQNEADVVALARMVAGSDIESAIADVAAREADMDAAKKALSASKKRLARAMRE